MAAGIGRKITRWMLDHLFWDKSGIKHEGFWAGLWATRKLIMAVAGSALLTWQEWREHHPPDIAIVAVIHFGFILAAIALVVYTWQWFSASHKKSPKHANNPHEK